MLDHIKEKIDGLETLASNFISTKKGPIFLKEKIAEIKNPKNLPMAFEFLLVAMSKNGGLIATCKTKGYMDVNKATKINRNIVVMHQNTERR